MPEHWAQRFTPKILRSENMIGNIEKRIKNQQDSIINNKKGKVAGYTCLYTPIELIRAAGLTPIRLFKGGDDSISSKGEIHTRSYFCQLTQFTIGSFRNNDPLYKAIDKVYTFNTCDQMKKTVEAIGFYYDVPSQIFALPRSRTDLASNFLYSEITRFKEELEDLSGNKISDDDINEQIIIHNKLRIILKKISELRKRKDVPLSGTEYLDLVKGYFYLKADEILPEYEDIYEKLEKNGGTEPTFRLMMAGGPIADGDRKILDLVEKETGARIIVEDHCTGFRPFYDTIPENGDPLKALTTGYLNRSPCTRMKPLSDRLDFSQKLAEEYDVDGIIYTYLKFCTCHGIPKKQFLDKFSKIGIPVLDISNDYSQSDIGQLKTRLEAFFEVLEERRT